MDQNEEIFARFMNDPGFSEGCYGVDGVGGLSKAKGHFTNSESESSRNGNEKVLPANIRFVQPHQGPICNVRTARSAEGCRRRFQ